MQQVPTSPYSTTASGAPGDARKVIEDFHVYMGMLRRGWKLIAVCILAAVTAAALYVAGMKPVFRASSRLLVIQQGGRPIAMGGADPFSSVERSDDSLATQLMLIRSPIIVEQAIVESGFKHIPIPAVIANLTVKLPDPSAKIVELGYKSDSAEEAKRILDGVVESYNQFLKKNYQRNTNEVINLITKARDELNTELKSLEHAYLEYRQKNPAYSADSGGRSFISRRLDQWDQAMNQALARSLQLKSQLDLGRKLSSEGLDPSSISNAVSQLGVIAGGAAIAPSAPASAPALSSSDQGSFDGISRELSDVESQRRTSELLLAHFQRELVSAAANKEVSDREVEQQFYADPEVAELQQRLRNARSRYNSMHRLARSPSDPSIATPKRQVEELGKQIDRLWKERRPAIVEGLALVANPDLADAARKAETDLISLRARESALRERLDQAAADELQLLQQERADLVRRNGEGHALVAQIDKRIARIETRKNQPDDPQPVGKNDGLLDSLTRSLESIESMRKDLQKKFEEDLGASKQAEITQLEEANLRNNLDRQRTLFNSVVDQLKQAQIVSDFGSVSTRTIEATGVTADRPKTALILALAVILGGGLGGLAAFVSDLLDARVRTLSEIRKLLDLPVIGMIPLLSEEKTPGVGLAGLLSHHKPRSALAESYKTTRTNLDFLRRNRRAQVLLISSAHPGDGKSTTASNLAITLANTGRRVLLIDGDLRKPSLHRFYELAQDPGFSDALKIQGSVAGLIQPTFVPHLDLLTTGLDVSNPAELLASHRLGEILEELRHEYDTVIIDSSPLLAVTDPSIIASVADGLILVVRVMSTRRHDIDRTKELLATLGVPVFGMVINGITREQFGYGYGGYGYGYGGYGYGYGYGYGRNSAAKNGKNPYGPPEDSTNNGNGTLDHETNGSPSANGANDRDPADLLSRTE